MAQETSDREQIVDLIARMAQASDRGTTEEYAACLAEDMVHSRPAVETRGAELVVARGREAALANHRARRATGKVGPGSHYLHFVTTTSVKLGGDTATATSYVVTFQDGPGGPVPKRQFVYNDRFRRTADGWRICERLMKLP